MVGLAALLAACGGAQAQSPVPAAASPTEAPVATTAAEPTPTSEPSTEAAAPLVPSADGQVAFTMWEYGFELDHSGSEVGEVTFSIDNTAGDFSHEVVVYQTDLAGDDLPLDGKGNVDETSADLTVVDRLDRIEYQSAQSWTVELEPGDYVLVCNLPAHYRRGMSVEFDVVG
jgi:uncharacterized cupredoxin-like copper-binding protein